MFVVTYRKIFYTLSLILVGGSIAAIVFYGLNLGIDFKGGSIVEVEYKGARPELAVVQEALRPLELKESTRPTGEQGYIIRTRSITDTEHAAMVKALGVGAEQGITEKRFDSIGPVLGAEAVRRSFASIILVILAIVLFIAYAFRHVSEPVSSWKYGLVAVVALFHDVIVPTGVFAVLGHYFGYEIDTLFVTAILVILGFSVHDTIVVFDRVRENLRMGKKEEFEVVVGRSISQTITRSINTSLTTLLALVALYFVGSETTRHFSLVLLIGITVGTYSSVFIGSPLLVTLQKFAQKKAKN